jgi:hypothetical protein
MTDDRFDEYLKDAAEREYHAPPPTPTDEMWARVEAARRNRSHRPTPVVSLGWRRPWTAPLMAVAAVLLLGIGIGRWIVPEITGGGRDDTTDATTSTATTASMEARRVRGESATRYYALDHLRRVEYLLTDYQTGRVTDDFRNSTRGLLTDTRQLLDSPQLKDPKIRRLLEDLEVLLAQVAQLTPNGQGEERALIDDNLAERAIRRRLRNVIPAGPTA